jgi:hypothetical protein
MQDEVKKETSCSLKTSHLTPASSHTLELPPPPPFPFLPDRPQVQCPPRSTCNWTVAHVVSCHLRHRRSIEELKTMLVGMAASRKKALEAMGLPHEELLGSD